MKGENPCVEVGFFLNIWHFCVLFLYLAKARNVPTTVGNIYWLCPIYIYPGLVWMHHERSILPKRHFSASEKCQAENCTLWPVILFPWGSQLAGQVLMSKERSCNEEPAPATNRKEHIPEYTVWEQWSVSSSSVVLVQGFHFSSRQEKDFWRRARLSEVQHLMEMGPCSVTKVHGYKADGHKTNKGLERKNPKIW